MLENKSLYKKLIWDLAGILVEFIEELPESGEDLSRISENNAAVDYRKGKKKKKPLNME